MGKVLTLGSLFDGIGGWCLAAERFGVRPLWSSEIETFPLAVTKRRFPDVQQLGDITKLDGATLPPVDIICAGSPCQDLSVAGKQEGLKGARSGLFLRAIEIVRRMRMSTGGDIQGSLSGKTSPVRSLLTKAWTLRPCWKRSQKPKFQYLKIKSGQTPEWLNVLSVKLHGGSWMLNFSESPNVAVESFLRQILEPAEDVPDKFFLSDKACKGILRRAKRRKKELPFQLRRALIIQARECGWKKRERLRMMDKVRRERKAVDEGANSDGHVLRLNDQGGGVMSTDVEKCGTLRAEMHGNVPIVMGFSTGASAADNAPVLEEKVPCMRTTTRLGVVMYDNHPQDSRVTECKDVAPTVSAKYGTGGNNVPLVMACGFKAGQSKAGGLGYEEEKAPTLSAAMSGLEPTVVTYCISSNTIDRQAKNGGNGLGVHKEIAYTLDTARPHVVCIGNGQVDQLKMSHKVGALNCMHDQQCVFIPEIAHTLRGRQQLAFRDDTDNIVCQAVDCRNLRETDTVGTLQCKENGGWSLNYQNPVRYGQTVRRLTPLECERLQGLPDGWTLINDRSCSDSARYKALGNGMAQPCPDFVIKRLVEETEKE